MSRFNTLLITLALLCRITATSQGIHGVIGADAWMQGGNSTTLNNSFSVINNPSQMSLLKTWQAGIYNEQRLGRRELSLSAISLVLPNKFADVGFGMNYFGFSDFNRQRFVFSASKKLARTLSLGAQLNYIRTAINEYGSAGAFVFGAGVSYQPSDKISMGFTIYNPGQRNYSAHLSDKIPAYARFGLQYKVNEKVYALAGADQETSQHTTFRGGVRYEPHKRISFAAGASTQPVICSFGASVKAAGITIDMAAGIHQVLGVTPQLGIRFPSSSN